MAYVGHSVKSIVNGIRSNEDFILHLFQFVDDFRYLKDAALISEEPDFSGIDKRQVALIASTVEYLCFELKIPHPAWTKKIGALEDPYFVSGMENLKAMAIAESPPEFRMRMIFVLSNFMSRA